MDKIQGTKTHKPKGGRVYKIARKSDFALPGLILVRPFSLYIWLCLEWQVLEWQLLCLYILAAYICSYNLFKNKIFIRWLFNTYITHSSIDVWLKTGGLQSCNWQPEKKPQPSSIARGERQEAHSELPPLSRWLNSVYTHKYMLVPDYVGKYGCFLIVVTCMTATTYALRCHTISILYNTPPL